MTSVTRQRHKQGMRCLEIPKITTVANFEPGAAELVINDVKALVGAVQMSTIELHSWNGTTADLDQPDRFVLDLDPAPALSYKAMLGATQLALAWLGEPGFSDGAADQRARSDSLAMMTGAEKAQRSSERLSHQAFTGSIG